MGVFTTNWYLYKTHFHANSIDSKTQRPRNSTEVYGVKRGKQYLNPKMEAK